MYVEPKNRRGMNAAGGDGGMSSMSDDAPGETAPAQAEAPPSSEAPRAFLKKEMFAGKQVKPGDEFYFRAVAVDPETGEVEIEYATGKGKGEGDEEEPQDSMQAMDKAMPPEEEEQPAGAVSTY
jgi:hypothetical protein